LFLHISRIIWSYFFDPPTPGLEGWGAVQKCFFLRFRTFQEFFKILFDPIDTPPPPLSKPYWNPVAANLDDQDWKTERLWNTWIASHYCIIIRRKFKFCMKDFLGYFGITGMWVIRRIKCTGELRGGLDRTVITFFFNNPSVYSLLYMTNCLYLLIMRDI